MFWLFIDLLAGEGGRGGIKSLRVTARKRAENLLARHLFSCQINQRLSAIFEATIFPEKGIWKAYGKITEGPYWSAGPPAPNRSGTYFRAIGVVRGSPDRCKLPLPPFCRYDGAFAQAGCYRGGRFS